MTEVQLASLLQAVVRAHPPRWDEDFERLVVNREAHFTELTYQDSGVGEDYVRRAIAAEWPDRSVEVDTHGGCDSCGYGRTVSVTISGTVPPWEGQ